MKRVSGGFIWNDPECEILFIIFYKRDYISFKILSLGKSIPATAVVINVKILLHMWAYDFHDTALSI